MITFIAHLCIAPSNASAFEALVTQVADQTHRHEPGVVYYEWAKSADEADTYIVIEVYRDAEAHAVHMASPWVKKSLPKSAALIEGRPRLRQYTSGDSLPVRRSVESD